MNEICLSSEEFVKQFVHDKFSNGAPFTIITHEFFYNSRRIKLGFLQCINKYVAIKSGIDLEGEIVIYKKLQEKQTHPNVLQYYGTIENEDLILEGIKGATTLSDWRWSTNDPAPIDTCIDAMYQLAKGLKHIHNCNIIHHDLKSDNILVDTSTSLETPRFVICDFDCAEVVDSDGNGSESNRTCGTELAPEQKDELQPITTKMDVYNFSNLCFSILGRGRDAQKIQQETPKLVLVLIQMCRIKKVQERLNSTQVVLFFEKLILEN